MKFYKYHGAGNDFILTEDYNNWTPEQIQKISSRRMGVGANGVLNVRKEGESWHIFYYNSNGEVSTFCGNGTRCAVHHIAYHIKDSIDHFLFNGLHHYNVRFKDNMPVTIMPVLPKGKMTSYGYFINTGSPHLVREAENLQSLHIKKDAVPLRYNDEFEDIGGVNVNFINGDEVRTYERGVEDETYSCGTGAIAVACYKRHVLNDPRNEFPLSFPGGTLTVYLLEDSKDRCKVALGGSIEKVFTGEY